MVLIGPQEHPQPSAWLAVRTDVDPLALVVVYLGGLDDLGPDRVEVDDTDDVEGEIVVRLTSNGTSGYLAGVFRHVRVRLRAPLGARLVMDPARGVRHEAFDGTRMLQLVPPPGFRPPWETAPGASTWHGQAPTAWCQTTAPTAGRGSTLTLCHSTDINEPDRVDANWGNVGHLPTDPAVPVRRHLARRALTASWLDPDSGHRLTLTGGGTLPFTADDPFLQAARAWQKGEPSRPRDSDHRTPPDQGRA